MRGCEQWPLPDLETKSGIVLFFQLKHKHKPTKDSRLVWKFQLCTNYSSCGFVDFLYKNGSGGITHMTLEWKEPNKSQLWWRDPVEREKREGCLIWTMPFPLFPWAFSTGGWDKAALNSKSCLSMIGAIKKPAVQLCSERSSALSLSCHPPLSRQHACQTAVVQGHSDASYLI